MRADVVIIGGGTVGFAIGYGLAGRGADVLLLDGGDGDFRAAAANFGLVWLQGKGEDMPEYQRFTRASVDLWPDFCAELTDSADIDLQYEKNGGLALCLGEEEFESKRASLQRLHNRVGAGPDADWEMVDRRDLAKLMPNVTFGPDVTGAGYGLHDGHVNPLYLLAALQTGMTRKGGRVRGNATAHAIQKNADDTYTVKFNDEQVTAARIVIAAGLGSKTLAAQVGLDIPIRPLRGQILVTERLDPFLSLPMSGLRQTREGTVMIGFTHENVGLDKSTTVNGAAAMSANALRRIPALSGVKLVRQWAGLRIMTPDSYPIYTESPSCPGVFVTLCHSGVTLAAIHASLVADAIIEGRLPASLDVFHERRFGVSQAA